MGIIKTLAYILAYTIGCLVLGVVWFITFALGYIMQGTWAGALSFMVNMAINAALARKIREDGDREVIYNDYMYNRKFREYVDKYCQKHGCTVDEALTHELMRQVHRHYTEV